MGKYKNKKWRLHNSAPKQQISEKRSQDSCAIAPGSIKYASNLFKSVEIPVKALELQAPYQSLTESSKTSLVNEIGSLDPVKKRRKRMALHLSRCPSAVERDRTTQKRKYYGALASFDSLNEALPSLQELTELRKLHKSRKEKEINELGRPNSFKRLDREIVNAVETFQAVLKDEAYKSDPFNAISLHLKRRLEAERKQK